MARKLSTEEICDAIAEIGENERKAAVRDILADLTDFMKQGADGYGDENTWEAGFKAAIATIKANYISE